MVRQLSYQINDTTATTDVQFTFRINQGVVPGYQLDIFPKVAQHDLNEFDPPTTVVEIPNGASMDVLVRVRAGDVGTYLVGAVYGGWWYPEQLNDVEAE